MIGNIDQLKKERPDLVELFEKMTKEDLVKQCYLECIDAINMEERVSLFMANCTNNMSKTNYTLDSVKSLIDENKEREIDSFCYDVCEDREDYEILKEIKEHAENYV